MEEFITNNIKILIFVGAAVLWVIGKISEARKNKEEQQQEQQQPWSPEDDDGYDYDERQEPVPPPYRPVVPPPLPRAVAAPDLPSDDRELARQRAMQERLSALRKERTAVSKAARKPAKAAPQPMVSPSSLKARLRDRRELRRAIVMREILDPPVGLR
jgi:type IV secretory pathway VirB10-like protein